VSTQNVVYRTLLELDWPPNRTPLQYC